MNCTTCNNMSPHVHEPALVAEIERLRAEIGMLHRNYTDLLREKLKADDKVKLSDLQNGELRDALQNMTGLFGEAVTRHQMGKGFSELHAEAVKAAKAILAKTEKRKCICPNGTRTAIAHVSGCPLED